MASTLFTAGIILGITFLFIFFFSLLHKEENKSRWQIKKQDLMTQFLQITLTINEKEQFEHYYIAIDTLNAKLLYFNFSSEEEDVKVIDLQKTKTARVDIEENSIYEDKKGKSVFVEKQIAKLQLELASKDAGKSEELLTFYQLY